MTTTDYDGLLVFASGLAKEAGAIMRQYFHGADQQITHKEDATLLTVADTQVNDLVIRRIVEAYPTHGVRGEEASYHSDRRELWVCDPIDGTDGFTIGVPTAVFSLAYVVDGVPQLAVTLDPFQDRMYSAIKGRGAFCNGRVLHVSHRPAEGAIVAVSSNFREIERNAELYKAAVSRGMTVRMFGGLVFKGNLIAEGKIDGVLFPYCGAHDVAAVKLIVEEAGGRVTDIYGNEQRYDQPITGAIISNGLIHDDLAQLVAAYGIDSFLNLKDSA
jgi:fructose-1,6-bisphosphatase/inositol monophosphatase family enzyme